MKYRFQSGGTNYPSLFSSEGWKPKFDLGNGRTIYRNGYKTSLNTVDIPEDKTTGFVSLIGNKNGSYDIGIVTDGGKIKKYISQGIDGKHADDYFTNNLSNINKRNQSIINGTNIDKANTDGSFVSLKKGGLSPQKAHEMLKDGTANGHKLTPKQKRYFGYVYGKSKMQDGGIIPVYNNPPPKYNFYNETPDISDSVIYKNDYEGLLHNDPFHINEYKKTLQYGISPNLKPDAYSLAMNKVNAYNDAMNVMNVEKEKRKSNPWYAGIGYQPKKQEGGYSFLPFVEDNIDDLDDYKAIDDIINMKSGGWISGAVNPAHKGYCTPMTKSTCTPRRKAFAKRAKAHFK